ncbi:ribbon-helix-helix protein, CopG family [Candidatus Gottesmanbacteria bacterium]|nr:ribbon-helix-helix protein, CopG family [Candidatus Gottesmanbacteria bacterium]
MLKTYLYVPDELEKKIIQTAKAQNKSKAEIIRRALEKGIASIAQQGTASAQVLLKIAELGKINKVKGPKDSVEKFDEYLYGKDWSKEG